MSARNYPFRCHSLTTRPAPHMRRSQTCAHSEICDQHTNTESSTLFPILEFDYPTSHTDHDNYPNFAEQSVESRFQDEDFCVVIEEVLSSYLKEFPKYKHNICGRLCKLISDLIKCRIEEVCGRQYKITVNVFLGEIRDEGIDAASQCTLTPVLDKFATASYKNESLFAVGTVFATYNYQSLA